ncbi:hypothetical protein LINPERHAP2_LOCUS5718 [Linum perenne]
MLWKLEVLGEASGFCGMTPISPLLHSPRRLSSFTSGPRTIWERAVLPQLSMQLLTSWEDGCCGRT